MKINIYIVLLVLTFSSCVTKKVIAPDETLYADKKVKNKDTKIIEHIPQGNTTISVKSSLLPYDIQNLLSAKLGVSPEKLQNDALYAYVASWLDVPYLWGGDDRNGIDCSAFVQQLYRNVYEKEIPRTSIEQFLSSKVTVFKKKKYLKEGDLIFFRINRSRSISHVGVYLQNNKFVASGGSGGVQIEDLNEPHWIKTYVSSGRVSTVKK